MKRVMSFFDERGKFAFIATIVGMFIAHGYCFSNLLFSHDSLYFYDTLGMHKVGLGRWLYPFLVNQRGFATPWIMGVLSVIYVAFAVVIVVKIFDFNKMQSICVATVFTTNITLTTLFSTYVFDADADCLALLFACLAVYAYKKHSKIYSLTVPIIFLVFCLALYQAYVCVAIGLFLLYLIYESRKVTNWCDVLHIGIEGIKQLFVLGMSILIYLPSMKIFSEYYNVGLSNAYNGASRLNELTMDTILNALPKAYESLFDKLFNITQYNNVLMTCINVIFIILIFVLIYIYIVWHVKMWERCVVVFPIILLLPLGLNAISIISMGVMHELMIFAFYIIYLVPFVFLNTISGGEVDRNTIKRSECIKEAIGAVSIVLILVIGFHNVIYSNGAYVYKKLLYDNTALHAQTIWKDVNSLEGYEEGMHQVVFVGEVEKSKLAYSSSIDSRYLDELIGMHNNSISYDSTIKCFYEAILGRKMIINYNIKEDVQKNEFVSNMPNYPCDGYCRMVDGFVVVKLSDY